MLHCWQPKHKYALNCCQAGRSRKKKSSVSGFTALEKRRLPQPARAHRELLALPQALLLGGTRRNPEPAAHSTKGVLERETPGRFSYVGPEIRGTKSWGETQRCLWGRGGCSALCVQLRSWLLGSIRRCFVLQQAAGCCSVRLVYLAAKAHNDADNGDRFGSAGGSSSRALPVPRCHRGGTAGSTGLGSVLVWVRKGLSSPNSPGLNPWEGITNYGQVLHGNSG